MPKVFVINREGAETVVAAEVGTTVMELIRDSGFDELQALCGGCCSCATCHVFIDPEYMERLPPMTEAEDDLLDSSDKRISTSRLSCQIRVVQELDGLRVKIAPED